MEDLFEAVGFSPAEILLPRDVDMTKWAVVACDQFTSQPEYWQAVEDTVADAPSALRLILPEAYLEAPDVDRRIAAAHRTMERYLEAGMFRTWENTMLYVERTQSDGKIRRGLVGKIDLERYDFTPGSGSLIRATEETVLDRIPPRVRVRQGAALELPHVMLLIDDSGRTVIEPLSDSSGEMEPVYDFALQQGGGHLAGWRLSRELAAQTAAALAALCRPEVQAEKYGGGAPMLFAVGDGNHSLAAAKACYEARKQGVPPSRWAELPARYALVEVVNLHDDALAFAPIHRVLFGADPAAFQEVLRETYPQVRDGRGRGHIFEAVWAGQSRWFTIPDPADRLAVGTLQSVLERYLERFGGTVDYIHGDAAARELGLRPGNMGFLLPPVDRTALFGTVMEEGVLPRKTFSMGQARDKRYYVESRRIR